MAAIMLACKKTDAHSGYNINDFKVDYTKGSDNEVKYIVRPNGEIYYNVKTHQLGSTGNVTPMERTLAADENGWQRDSPY
jgi:hypothetical protein